jgi:hypothetical protein
MFDQGRCAPIHRAQRREVRGGNTKSGTAPEHAEHVPEVGTRPHPNVLDDIREDFPAFDHALLQHHEILFRQGQVRRESAEPRQEARNLIWATELKVIVASL